jgi:hypothetical protein
VAALGLVGIALQIKYSVVFEGMFFGLWWLWREYRLGAGWLRVIGGGVVLVVVALLPTAIAWLSYRAIGHEADFVYANFSSILARRPDPMTEQLGNLFVIVLLTSPLLSAAILAWTVRSTDEPERSVQHWLFAWSAAAILGLLAFGSWFEHYALPILVPVAACASGFVAAHRSGAKAALPVLLIALVAGQTMLVLKRHNRGTPEQFAQMASAIGKGPGCLYVYSGDSIFYAVSERCRLSRYVFPSHIGRIREDGAIGVDQQAELQRILALRPQVVVFRAPYFGERAELRALAMAEMARHYRLKAHVPYGNNWNEVYVRR